MPGSPTPMQICSLSPTLSCASRAEPPILLEAHQDLRVLMSEFSRRRSFPKALPGKDIWVWLLNVCKWGIQG